jgi:DNA-binding PadR family transcriptional regulator
MSEIRPVVFAKMPHGRRGAGGFFSRRGGGLGGGDPDFSRGRKLSFDELQLLLVALLADAPRHGYELIKLLETRSNGFYIPSPGMIYPALTDLEQGGYAAAVAAGNRRSYSLTPAGRAYLETNRDRIDVMWAKLDLLGKKMGLVRKALAGEGTHADAATTIGPSPEVTAARLKLEQQLVARRDASPPEQLRIAAVLERAAVEIEANADQD